MVVTLGAVVVDPDIPEIGELMINPSWTPESKVPTSELSSARPLLVLVNR